jgi:hypothetical protein
MACTSRPCASLAARSPPAAPDRGTTLTGAKPPFQHDRKGGVQ